MQHWNYSLPVAAGASVQVLVTAVSAWIEARTPPPDGSTWPGLVPAQRQGGNRAGQHITLCARDTSFCGSACVQLKLKRYKVGWALVQVNLYP